MPDTWGQMLVVPPEERFPGLTARAPVPPSYAPTPPDEPPPPFFVQQALPGQNPQTSTVVGAALNQNNEVAGAFDLLTRPTYPPDPSYDVFSDPEVTGPKSLYGQYYLDRFVGVQSKAEAQAVMQRIDREQAQQATLARAGWIGTVASIAAGALSPTVAIPVGGWLADAYRFGRAGNIALRAAEAAAVGAGGAAAQEAILQRAQETRSAAESFYNIAGAGILTGILGGILSREAISALHERIKGDIAAPAPKSEAPIADPLDAVTFNARLAANGVAEADRADFAAAYGRIADQYSKDAAQLETIRTEAGQPTTAPEYVAEATRLAEVRDREIAQLQSILDEYRAQTVVPTGEPTVAQRLATVATEAPKPHAAPETVEATPSEVPAVPAKPAQPAPSTEQIAAAASPPLLRSEAIKPETPAGAPLTEPNATKRGVSKIGKSIETKAVDARLTNGFEGTAGYDKITIKDQAERATKLVNEDVAKARAVVRGEEPLPSGLHGTALITAMEEHLRLNPSAEVAYELANSPLVSATSEAAQSLRLAAERAPDSIAAKFREIRAARQTAFEKRGGTEKVAKEVRGAISAAASKRPTWEAFIREIAC